MDVHLSVERDGVLHELEASAEDDIGPAPEHNRGFQELQEVVFHGPQDGSSLLLDDALLSLQDEDRPGVWAWEPGFYAGEVEVRLQDKTGACRGRWRLDVSPNAEKLGRCAFEEMLRDIWKYDAALALGTEPARRLFGALGEHQRPFIEYLRLRRRAEDIEKSLRALLEDPFRSLRTRRQLLSPHLVRRADRRTARSALGQPELLVPFGGARSDGMSRSTYRPVVDVPDVVYHYDNPTNRCLLYALGALVRRSKSLRDKLKSLQGRHESVVVEDPSGEESYVKERLPEWLKFIEPFHRKLAAVGRRRPFAEVTKAEVTAAGLNAVAAHPLCARFWRVSWEALRHGVAGPEPVDWLPLNPTWEIYERWCFLALSRCLSGLLQEDMELGWQRSAPAGVELLLTGELKSGTTVRLHLQRIFGSSNNAPREFWSISRQRKPDIVLDWKRGHKSGFLIFDAKYRVRRSNLLDAMGTAHIYNDSLRMNRAPPVASVLLTPANTEVPWLETPEFFDEHRSGILPLHPGRELPCWFQDRVVTLLG